MVLLGMAAKTSLTLKLNQFDLIRDLWEAETSPETIEYKNRETKRDLVDHHSDRQ